MDRAEHERSISEKRTQRMLFESDYLLGVNDEGVGALFSYVKEPKSVIRYLMSLGMLSATERVIADKQNAQDLKLLLDPGSSLGGAQRRPYATKTAPCRKIPKQRPDTANVAARTGKTGRDQVPLWRLKKVLNKSVLLIKRFDRVSGQRVPFLSVSMLATITNARYLDIESTRCLPNEDLANRYHHGQQHRHHLRNHGFSTPGTLGVWLTTSTQQSASCPQP